MAASNRQGEHRSTGRRGLALKPSAAGSKSRFREVYQAMRTNLFRGLVLGTLIFTLMFPAGEIRALAQTKDKQPPQAPPSQTPGGFSISVTVPVVSVDVVITDNNGNFLPGLKKENFRITEEGAGKKTTNSAPPEPPTRSCCILT